MNEMNPFDGIFGKIQHGCCRLAPNGKIAIKTSNGYKTYNTKTDRLTNCANFAFNVGEDMFFVIPTNKVKVGDIIMVNGTPRCVISADKNEIIALNYENSTKETIIPERHIFMGKSYLYGKIVSLMGNMAKGNGLMKYMMISEMLKDTNSGGAMNTNAMFSGNGNDFVKTMALMSMFGGADMFDGMFDVDDDSNGLLNFDEDDDEDEKEETEE